MCRNNQVPRSLILRRLAILIRQHWHAAEMADYQSHRKGSLSLASVGHHTRAAALVRTYRAVLDGNPCNRAVAQIYGKGVRACKHYHESACAVCPWHD